MVTLRLLGAAGVVVALGAGCGSARPPSPAQAVVARVGDLEVVHPYLPDPASPAVAAVYLTVRNTGRRADRLLSVTSPSATSAMLMTESETGADAGGGDMGTMAPLRSLTIPGRGSAALVPGAEHLMLENPTGLKIGDKVEVLLRFADAGSVTVEVPVVPLSALIDNDGAPMPAGDTTMKGMDMAMTVPS